MAKALRSDKAKPKARRRPIKKAGPKTAATTSGGAAKKAAGSPKASSRKPTAKKRAASPRMRQAKARPVPRIIPHAVTTLLVLIGFLIMAAAGAYVFLKQEVSEKSSATASSSAEPARPAMTKTPKTLKASKTTEAVKPVYEVFPAHPELIRAPVKAPVHREPAAPGKSLPRVAIIIDDIGHDKKIAEKFFTLDAPLTYAILPYSRFHAEIAGMAHRMGYEVMLHLPMEPNEYPLVDPGPGALTAAMTPDERIEHLKRNIDAVAHIKGVNNHMGSKLTALSDEMNQVFGILKQRGLFFVDSRTTAVTQTRSSAKLFKVPYAERDVFLDHIQRKDEIRRQVDQLVNIAEIHGKAVAIGHPYQETFDVLAEVLSDLKKRIKLVPASEIVEVF